MKRVLFVTKSEMIGGIEKVLIDISSLLDKSRYEITVMTGQHNEEMASSLPKHVQYKSIFAKRFRGLDRILIYLPPALLHKIFIKHTYDVEISFQEGYPTKLIAGADKRTRKIIWFHNDPLYYDFNLPFFKSKVKLKHNLEQFDEIIAVSHFIADNYKKYMNLNKKIKVIYNPIDFNKIVERSNEKVSDLEHNRDKFRIIYVGRLSVEKQVELLVDSVVSLHKKNANIELVIVGDGHKYNDIHNKINGANAYGYIKLLGYKDNPYPYIQNASLLVCCSQTESFSLVVAESMVLGTPVLSTKCGGPEELLENGKVGLIVDNDLYSVTRGIEEMMNNSELYHKYVNATKAQFNKFNAAEIAIQIEQTIEGVQSDEKNSSL